MRTEKDLGAWLDTLGVGRAGCAFASDVSDTLSVLEEAATSERSPFRVVSLTWREVPPLANELGLLVSALARATLDFFPSLYGLTQSTEPGRWSQTAVESEAHAAMRTVPDVDGVACRRILRACQRGEVPALGKLQLSEQARQLGLAIDPERLLVMIAVLNAPTRREPLRSLAQGAEWLASNARGRVALVLPTELSRHTALDHVTYDACLFADATEEDDGRDGKAPTAGTALRSPGPSRPAPPPDDAAPAEPVIGVSPIVGRPAQHSPAEQLMYQRLTNDEKLRPLFAYNRHVETRFGSNPSVDVLWEKGKLVVEIDGDDHRKKHTFSNDRVRDSELLLSGYLVLRFTDSRVIEQTDWVVERIRAAVRFISEGKSS